MSPATMDLNSDMGEAFGAYTMGPDAELLTMVTSANVACGFHAGDPRVMDRTVAMAAERDVTVGAHVSYPDLVGFGRRHLQVAPSELETDVLYQLGALDALCRRHGTAVRYVKAHGALYNDLAHDAALAGAMADAVSRYGADLALLTLPETAAAAAASAAGVRVVHEAFPDRAYSAAGRLVPRREPGSVLSTPEVVAERAATMARREPFTAHTGAPVAVDVETLCIHSDTPGAVALVTAVRQALDAAGIAVVPFA